MRYIIIFCLIFGTLQAKEKLKEETVTIGAGLYLQTQPYADVKPLLLPSPIIFFDNGIVYMRWTRVGLYFLGEKKEDYAWAFSLTAMPRTYGYASDDIISMKERKSSWEGGLSFAGKIDKSYIEIMLLTDILHKKDSFVVKTDIGYDFKVGKVAFYPSFNITYQSKSFINYYYGVTQEEATQCRREYLPNAGFQIGVQTYIKYPLTENLSTLLNLKIDELSEEAVTSPIVDNEYIYSSLLSLIYTFKF